MPHHWKVGDVCVCIKQDAWVDSNGNPMPLGRVVPKYRGTYRVKKVMVVNFNQGQRQALVLHDMPDVYRSDHFRPIEPEHRVDIFKLAEPTKILEDA